MAQALVLEARYRGDADAMFAAALDFSEMTDAMKGIAVYENAPEGDIAEGMTLSLDVTMFGFMKTRGHEITVERIDHANRIIQSRERNPSVRRWDHTISIQAEGDDGVLWTDRVEIDAGWQTWGTVRFAGYVYGYRHRTRRALSITRRYIRL